MKTMLKMFVAVAVVGMISGCAAFKQEAADRIDLGDGMVFDLVPVSVPEAVADKLVPGSGKAIALVESQMAAKRMAKLGPFNGLPYTTTRSVILKNGTVITQEEIAKIVETLTPLVPAAVTRVIEPADFGTKPAALPQGTNGPATVSGPATNQVDWAESDALLEEIGGAK